MTELLVKTKKKREIVDITDKLEKALRDEGRGTGVVNVFVTHTTAALATADLDPGGTDADYLDAFEQMVPKLNYRHPHDPTHMPDHILSTLIGTSLNIPLKNRKLVLGTWQRVILIELVGPRDRRIVVTVY